MGTVYVCTCVYRITKKKKYKKQTNCKTVKLIQSVMRIKIKDNIIDVIKMDLLPIPIRFGTLSLWAHDK